MGMGMPGGGRFFNDDIRTLAMIFASILLVVFFLTVLRLHFDKKNGRTAPLIPTRSTAPLIKAVLGQGETAKTQRRGRVVY